MKNLAIQSLGDSNPRENNFFSQFKRQWVAFLLTSISVLVMGGIVIYSLPDIYVAESKLEITSKELFLDKKGTANSSGAQIARRFYSTRDHILSSENITRILKENNLTDDNAGEEELQKLIAKFRKATSLGFIQGEIINPITTKEGLLRVGVEIKYESQSPQQAFKIADDLTTNFLETSSARVALRNNRKMEYLQIQMKGVAIQVRAAEEKLAAFKNENAMFLPDLQPVTMNRYSELKSELSQIEERLTNIQRREREIRANLATVSTDAFLYSADGTRVIGPAEKLTLLQVELANASAKFSRNHPDIARLNREIQQLQGIHKNHNTSDLEIELSEVKDKLASLKGKYNASHPDMKKLNSRKLSLEKILVNAKTEQRPRSTSVPNNPAYIRALTQLESVHDERSQVKSKKEGLNQELKTVNEQIRSFPTVQKQLVELEREKEQFSRKFDALEREYIQADLTKSMNDASLDERFMLVESPERPITPSKPHKLLLTALLVLLALSVGTAAVLIRETLNDRIWGKIVLQEFSDDPVFLIPKFR